VAVRVLKPLSDIELRQQVETRLERAGVPWFSMVRCRVLGVYLKDCDAWQPAEHTGQEQVVAIATGDSGL
jgi:hypothetical protein